MGILDFVAAIKVHFCKLSTKSQEIKTETSACRYLTANKNNPHGKKTKRKRSKSQKQINSFKNDKVCHNETYRLSARFSKLSSYFNLTVAL